MSMLPVSPRINLEQSRKQAKHLLKAFKSANPEVLESIRWHHPRLRGLSDAQIHTSRFTLADAQLVIARLHHFESWPKLLQYIEDLRTSVPGVTRFEATADAIVGGDIEKVRGLLHDHRQLVHERSSRSHHAPLLHYATANGVENYRQISPPNAVEIAELLLAAGADVDATSDAYGGGSTALLLVATSTPPRRAGVQLPLIDLLLERGAAIDGAWSRGSTVTAALANNCGEAARRLAERGASVPGVIEAAGIGDLDLVQKFSLAASDGQLEKALIMAARHGSYEVVEYLLPHNLAVRPPTTNPA